MVTGKNGLSNKSIQKTSSVLMGAESLSYEENLAHKI